MTPVILLTDGYIANGSAPWKIQSIDQLPEIKNNISTKVVDDWYPYTRDEITLARNWGIPGSYGFEHRLGGLEKDKVTGDVNQAPENHEEMTKIRAEKVKRVQNFIPDVVPEFTDLGDLLVIGWGGTYGSLHSAVKQINEEGYKNIGFAHFNYINPLPKNTESLLKRFKKIVVCELNNGQFAKVLRINFSGFEILQFNKIQGLPFGNNELIEEFKKLVK